MRETYRVKRKANGRPFALFTDVYNRQDNIHLTTIRRALYTRMQSNWSWTALTLSLCREHYRDKLAVNSDPGKRAQIEECLEIVEYYYERSGDEVVDSVVHAYSEARRALIRGNYFRPYRYAQFLREHYKYQKEVERHGQAGET